MTFELSVVDTVLLIVVVSFVVAWMRTRIADLRREIDDWRRRYDKLERKYDDTIKRVRDLERTARAHDKTLSKMGVVTVQEVVAYHLGESFNLEEIRTLASIGMGIDYDQLEGGSKGGKITSLVDYVERRGRMSELMELIQEERPHVSFTLWK